MKVPQLVSISAVSLFAPLPVCFGALKLTCFGSGSGDLLAAGGARWRRVDSLVVAAAAPDQDRADDDRRDQREAGEDHPAAVGLLLLHRAGA